MDREWPQRKRHRPVSGGGGNSAAVSRTVPPALCRCERCARHPFYGKDGSAIVRQAQSLASDASRRILVEPTRSTICPNTSSHGRRGHGAGCGAVRAALPPADQAQFAAATAAVAQAVTDDVAALRDAGYSDAAIAAATAASGLLPVVDRLEPDNPYRSHPAAVRAVADAVLRHAALTGRNIQCHLGRPQQRHLTRHYQPAPA